MDPRSDLKVAGSSHCTGRRRNDLKIANDCIALPSPSSALIIPSFMGLTSVLFCLYIILLLHYVPSYVSSDVPFYAPFYVPFMFLFIFLLYYVPAILCWLHRMLRVLFVLIVFAVGVLFCDYLSRFPY